MAITVAQFRIDFPAFADVAAYPEASLTFWLNLAYSMLNANVWGNQLDIAAELYTAHNIVLEKRAELEAANGDVPGTTTGPINSKSVDKISVGFDTGAATREGASHYNMTIYGTRLWRLILMFGKSPIFVGVGAVPVGSGLAWPGPLTTPGMSNF
jgi:hypothetical protein